MNHELDDIYSALADGHRAAESLITHQRHVDGYNTAQALRDSCARGIKAFDLLRSQLRDGKRHIEPPADWKPTECYCSATSHPPCSFCESGAGKDES